jgi:hypothetical protein
VFDDFHRVASFKGIPRGSTTVSEKVIVTSVAQVASGV